MWQEERRIPGRFIFLGLLLGYYHLGRFDDGILLFVLALCHKEKRLQEFSKILCTQFPIQWLVLEDVGLKIYQAWPLKLSVKKFIIYHGNCYNWCNLVFSPLATQPFDKNWYALKKREDASMKHKNLINKIT